MKSAAAIAIAEVTDYAQTDTAFSIQRFLGEHCQKPRYFAHSSSSSSLKTMSARPNILITGTPGTGKTETAKQAAERTGLKHINVGDLVKQHECHEGKDEDFDSYIVDDDKICDLLEPIVEEGGCIIDFHSCELFPERWFELVLVLRADTAVLFDRLTARGYSDRKRSENLECEIMQVVLEEARESYDAAIVHELQSSTVDELESNVERIVSWYESWKENNKADA